MPSEDRYKDMKYRRCGSSGVRLPEITLGLWHNFGDVDDYNTYRKILLTAFDKGINHFDLANNYGPSPGSAENNFGKILHADLKTYRDELIIATKAGYLMWDGPFGEWGSRKYLLSSLDQSLKRMNLDYVDIFYSHRFDPETPLEETMGALDSAVKQGKSLYAGISNYDPDQSEEAVNLLRDMGTPCLVHQPKYNMLHREPEEGLFDVLEKHQIGSVVFSPLAQGILTKKYLKSIPEDSRAGRESGFLQKDEITPEVIEVIRQLNNIAENRGQTLPQMALAWCLKDDRVTSVIIGARTLPQLKDNLQALDTAQFTDDEINEIESILN